MHLQSPPPPPHPPPPPPRGGGAEESSLLCSCMWNHVCPLHGFFFMGATKTGHGTCFEVACLGCGGLSHAIQAALLDHGHATSGD